MFFLTEKNPATTTETNKAIKALMRIQSYTDVC